MKKNNILSTQELMLIAMYCMNDNRCISNIRYNKKTIKALGFKLFKSISPEFNRIFDIKSI